MIDGCEPGDDLIRRLSMKSLELFMVGDCQNEPTMIGGCLVAGNV